MDAVPVMELANSPVLWALALGTLALVVWQALWFTALARRYVRDTGVLTADEVKRATRVGVIATFGPAIAVITVAIVLVGLIGGPVTLSRVGVIGSAAFEGIMANAGSGGTAGTPAFTPELFTTATLVMAIAGAGWIVSTLLLNRRLEHTQKKMISANPALVGLVAAMAPFMVFLVTGYAEVSRGLNRAVPTVGPLVALLVAAAAMYLFSRLGRRESMSWLREWGLGIAIVVGMIAGAIAG